MTLRILSNRLPFSSRPGIYFVLVPSEGWEGIAKSRLTSLSIGVGRKEADRPCAHQKGQQLQSALCLGRVSRQLLTTFVCHRRSEQAPAAQEPKTDEPPLLLPLAATPDEKRKREKKSGN
ncbi:hypothetical protein AOLI_G00100630 [Acnodon oligacanthus]